MNSKQVRNRVSEISVLPLQRERGKTRDEARVEKINKLKGSSFPLIFFLLKFRVLISRSPKSKQKNIASDQTQTGEVDKNKQQRNPSPSSSSSSLLLLSISFLLPSFLSSLASVHCIALLSLSLSLITRRRCHRAPSIASVSSLSHGKR